MSSRKAATSTATATAPTTTRRGKASPPKVAAPPPEPEPVDTVEVVEPKPKRTRAPRTATSKAKAAPATKVTESTSNDEETTTAVVDKLKRVFKIHNILEPTLQEDVLVKVRKGQYKGTSPTQAARKAFSQALKKTGDNDKECEYVFILLDTKGKRQYKYTGTHKALPEPKVIKRKDTEYFVKFDNVVKMLKEETVQ